MSVHRYSTTADDNLTVGDGLGPVGIQEGMPREHVNNAMRAMCADIARDYSDQGSIETAGTNAALTLTTTADINTLRNGLRFTFKAHATVAAGATLAVNGLPAEPLATQTPGGVVAVRAADVVLGMLVSVVRSDGQWVIQNPVEIHDDDDLTVAPTKAPTRANVKAEIDAVSAATLPYETFRPDVAVSNSSVPGTGPEAGTFAKLLMTRVGRVVNIWGSVLLTNWSASFSGADTLYIKQEAGAAVPIPRWTTNKDGVVTSHGVVMGSTNYTAPADSVALFICNSATDDPYMYLINPSSGGSTTALTFDQISSNTTSINFRFHIATYLDEGEHPDIFNP